MPSYGLDTDNSNGRHRNVREAIQEITQRLNHPGLSENDRSFIVSIISDPNTTIRFDEQVEAMEAQIAQLKQETLTLSREVQAKTEIISARDNTIEGLDAQVSELKEIYRNSKLEISRLKAKIESTESGTEEEQEDTDA